jgi:phosphoribosylformylglycinamidine cyclo-ligase
MRETGVIKAMAHITGGGFVDNIPRVLPESLCAHIDLDAINVLPVFSWLAEAEAISQDAMLRTFNCGIGLIMVTAADKAALMQKSLKAGGETVSVIGEVTARKRDAVTFSGKLKL